MVSMGKASCDGRFIRALSPTLKARVCKGSIVIFKRIRFSLKAKAFVFRKKSSFTYRVMHVYVGGGEKIYDVVLPADSTFLFFLCFRFFLGVSGIILVDLDLMEMPHGTLIFFEE
ncbi:hypothetical protein POPTR_010G221301v4 [Populus trichocarpa]|uniref:Uncharacterized protein n=1 Tax=Populus trichocarpa TaxID=3694 RepID=A0ACC0SEZ9_POPTR|nr:hypothetical protein POPTR_010G221301v4 [Populus trichocarpa]